MRLENKVALITGGYGGMGHASGAAVREGGGTVFIAEAAARSVVMRWPRRSATGAARRTSPSST